jgi:hypothetical protein
MRLVRFVSWLTDQSLGRWGHFGFVGGIGMVLCWIATFALLPALLVLLERLRPRRVRIRPLGHEKAVAVLEPLFRRPRAIVAVFAALTVAAAVAYIWHLPNAMEHNLDNLRNDEIGSAEVRRVHARAMGGVRQSIAGAIALLPSRAAADAYCAEIDSRMRRDPRVRTLINGCETFASVVPADQSEKLTLVRDMGERLSDRVLAHLPAAQAERAREIRAQLMGQHPLSEADAPRSLLDRFRERDGAIGRIAFVRAQPDAKLELVPRLREFAAAVRAGGAGTRCTGSSPRCGRRPRGREGSRPQERDDDVDEVEARLLVHGSLRTTRSTQGHPFTTPTGTSRATFLARPAR